MGLPGVAFTGKPADDKKILADFTGDGLNLSPWAYAQVLSKLTEKDTLKDDYYSLNGCVEKLEDAVIARAGISANELTLSVNETLLHTHAAELEKIFIKSLNQS